jgi:hypothetical protein
MICGPGSAVARQLSMASQMVVSALYAGMITEIREASIMTA